MKYYTTEDDPGIIWRVHPDGFVECHCDDGPWGEAIMTETDILADTFMVEIDYNTKKPIKH